MAGYDPTDLGVDFTKMTAVSGMYATNTGIGQGLLGGPSGPIPAGGQPDIWATMPDGTHDTVQNVFSKLWKQIYLLEDALRKKSSTKVAIDQEERIVELERLLTEMIENKREAELKESTTAVEKAKQEMMANVHAYQQAYQKA